MSSIKLAHFLELLQVRLKLLENCYISKYYRPPSKQHHDTERCNTQSAETCTENKQ